MRPSGKPLLPALADQFSHSLLDAGIWLARRLSCQTYLADLLNNRGNALRNAERALDALSCYDRALRLNPKHVKALYNRGNVLLGIEQTGDALVSYDRALQLKPDYADVHYNRGIALQRLGRSHDAVVSFEQAISLIPNDAEALNARGNALLDLKRSAEALASYDRALVARPDYAQALTNRGNALRDLWRPEDAIASYDHALIIKPGDADTLYNRGHALAEIGQNGAATASYRQALAANPAYVEARWSLPMAAIPRIAAQDENYEVSREDFACGLRDLETYFESRQLDGHDIVGISTPFYLAYQERNNRELLSAYGNLCVKLMERWQDKQVKVGQPKRQAGAPVRVGIVSAFVRNHSVWNAITKGWIAHLDRKSIELHIFSLGLVEDGETKWAKARVESFNQAAQGLREWVATISAKQIDVLIYPEIGMDPMTLKLASLRLARVQIAAWGHPETSGLPTIDYYLSAEAFEPPGRQTNYVEKLLALPNLGCCYAPLPVESIEPDFEKLGIGADGPILVCPGAPFKYAPQYDLMLIEIARRLGKCRFVFFTWRVKALSDVLRHRFEDQFCKANMTFSDYSVFIPWQSTAEFYGLMKRADIFLDTIGFSGFNTAIQAVECNLPIVTKDGEFMRGRLASGILKRMGMHETIATNNEEYIQLVVRLAQDADFRQQVRQRMLAAQGMLYNDISSVRALEQALVEMAG